MPAMRQLAAEGFMHNRARMTVASFLCKDLYVDWRAGAWHFWDLLSDGEIANNAGNWQWVAGTGNDTRPNRVLNPVRQAERFDPDGHYVRRYLPELEGVRGKAIFRPWLMEGFGRLDYPQPIVDHDEAAAAFKAHRGALSFGRRIGAMGRLAVILGSNALGPGGEEIAAAAAEHGAAIVQRHGAADGPYVLPHQSTTPPTCGR